MKNSIFGYHKYVFSPNVVLVEVSESFCEIVGCSEKEILSLGIEKIIHPDDKESYVRFFQTEIQKESQNILGYRILSSDGIIKYLKCSYILKDDCIYGVACDVTYLASNLEKSLVELKRRENEKYYKALSQTFDKIFEYDFEKNTVTFLYGIKAGTFEKLKNIPMSLKDATLTWVNNTVSSEDRERVNSFFNDYFEKYRIESNFVPRRIRYCAMSGAGITKTYEGMFLKVDESISLFCCRWIFDEAEAEIIKNENTYLKSFKENIKDIVLHFTDGLMGFELNGEYVKPLYMSENVRNFFGYSKEEWLKAAENGIKLTDFVSKSRANISDIEHLIQNGEGEFMYFNSEIGKTSSIKAFCVPKKITSDSPRYILLHRVKDNYVNTSPDKADVMIRTFGYFDVFVNGEPISFRNKKSKELLALLVDRRGGYVSSAEAISFLWENEPANSVTLSRYRKVALRLKNTLEEFGISHIVETSNGNRRVVVQSIKCDLFEYLFDGKRNLFKGSYLTNYSWGETTLGELSLD